MSRGRPAPLQLLATIVPAVLAAGAWFGFVRDRAPGTAAALQGFPLDDAWIHMVYARALVEEGGFHYNPGVPEAGMTSPLWVVLLAGVHGLTAGLGVRAVVLGAKLLALGFGIAGVIAMARLARALKLGDGASIVAACLFALDPSLTFSRAAGMEVPLFTFLVLLTLLLAVRGRIEAAAAAAGLGMVARPEGVLLLPVLVLLAARKGGAGVRGVRLAGATVLALLPPLLYAAFCLNATGAPLPNTFYAKVTIDPRVAIISLILGLRDYVHGNLPYFAFESGTVLALIGAAAIVRRAPRAGTATLGAGALLFLGTVASRQFALGHHHYWERWLVPSFPFLLLAIAAGWDEVASAYARLRPRAGRVEGPELSSAAKAFVALAVAVVLLAPMTALPRVFADRADTFAWNCQNIEETDVALGHWVDAHLPRGAVIGVADAGALRYFGQRVTVDLGGLNDHRVRRAVAERRLVPLLKESGVRWFALFPAQYQRDIARLGLVPVETARAPHYTVADAPQDEVVVYRWDRP